MALFAIASLHHPDALTTHWIWSRNHPGLTGITTLSHIWYSLLLSFYSATILLVHLLTYVTESLAQPTSTLTDSLNWPLTYLLAYLPVHLLAYSRTHIRSHFLAYLRTEMRSHFLAHSSTLSLPHSLTHSITHLPTCSLIHFAPHGLVHSLTHSITYSLTYLSTH